MALYVGAIEARAGFLKCGRQYAFGADTESSHINVCSGATVLCEMTADEGNWCVSLSSDGKSLEVRPTGLYLIFRVKEDADICNP